MRKTERLPRREFLNCCPEENLEDFRRRLEEQWEHGCEEVEFTVDSMGRIDSESSPRPVCPEK